MDHGSELHSPRTRGLYRWKGAGCSEQHREILGPHLALQRRKASRVSVLGYRAAYVLSPAKSPTPATNPCRWACQSQLFILLRALLVPKIERELDVLTMTDTKNSWSWVACAPWPWPCTRAVGAGLWPCDRTSGLCAFVRSCLAPLSGPAYVAPPSGPACSTQQAYQYLWPTPAPMPAPSVLLHMNAVCPSVTTACVLSATLNTWHRHAHPVPVTPTCTSHKYLAGAGACAASWQLWSNGSTGAPHMVTTLHHILFRYRYTIAGPSQPF